MVKPEAEVAVTFGSPYRDLSVSDDVKVKHAHYGYVGSLIHYYLATRDPDFLQFERELMDLTAERMMDPNLGWVYGYNVRFDRQWRPIESGDRGNAAIGAQLTAALAFLRLHRQSGEARYLELGKQVKNSETSCKKQRDRIDEHHPCHTARKHTVERHRSEGQ